MKLEEGNQQKCLLFWELFNLCLQNDTAQCKTHPIFAKSPQCLTSSKTETESVLVF